jgi:hypothetical protein
VRAAAEHSNGARKPSTPARFDTAVVIEDEEVYEEGQVAGTWCMFYCNFCSKFHIFLKGLRVAEIRAIFKLPSQFGKFTQPPVYIHWFKPFQAWDPQLGMFKLSRST